MMAAGDEKIVADQLVALLSNPPHKDEAPPSAAAAADLSGQWDVKVEYAAGASNHALNLRQRGNDIDGAHRGDFISRDVTGTIDGDNVRIRSFFSEQSGDSIAYNFTGKVTGDEMGGTLDMGEYLGGKWSARRRGARRG
jgi:L-seryl-tRNA(Ser) seleniumtransferase